jgi:hypothetical protein
LVSIEPALDCFCKELPGELVLDVFQHVSKKTRPYFQAKFVISIISRIPDDIRKSFLRWTVQLVEEIYADDGTPLSPRSLGDDALVALCKGLGQVGDFGEALHIAQSIESQNRRDEAILEILLTLERINNLETDVFRNLVEATANMNGNIIQMRGFEALSKFLIRLPNDALYSNWCIVLSSVRNHMRNDIFWHLRSLMPVIHKLGGEDAVDSTYQAIEEIRQLWP